MKWLARLKKTEATPEVEPTKPTKPGFAGFVGALLPPVQKIGPDPVAANDPTLQTTPAPDPHAWCLPSCTELTGKARALYEVRVARFTDKGLALIDAETLAIKLITRGQDYDDRCLCLECKHLAGRVGMGWKCRNWQQAGVALKAQDAGLPDDLVRLLQRCHGFNAST